ncbi:MAG TPA: AMP-binding protein [Nocardioides sp.]|nr:AMP-binding protein [Nocardioides sp.]
MSFWSPAPDPAEVVGQVRRWLDGPPDVRLVVGTSGSTGAPKRVVLARDAVLASVAASAARLGATGPWALALPASYVAGVQVLVRSLVAGHAPVVVDDEGWPAGEGWFTSLVPTQLARMVADPAQLAVLARAHTVLLGGGPVDQRVRAEAEEAGVRVVATYGAAETSGGCVYDGVPLDGVAVALGADGRIRIAGPTLFEGYLDDPRLTAEALVDGWYVTSDAGRIDEDGRLVVLGRVDDVVVTGGLNVPAPAVAARLREHPAVAEAEVLGVPDQEWGNRVVAFVVPRRTVGSSTSNRAFDHVEPSVLLADLRDWVAEERPRAWAPRQLVVLEEIPLLPNGKPDRRALRARA